MKNLFLRNALIGLFSFLISSFLFSTQVFASSFILSGQVRDQSNNGISEASLEVIDPLSNSIIANTSTDLSGNYSISVAGGSYTVHVIPPSGSGFQEQSLENISITGDTVLNIVLVQSFTVSYSGTIYDNHGHPLPGIELTLGNVSTLSGVDGSFNLNILPSTYSLSLHGQKLPGLDSQDVINLNVPNIVINTDTVQNLVIPTVGLSVLVIDSANNPITNAQPSVGEYVIEPFEIYPGKYASGTGFLSGQFTNNQGSAHWPMLVPTGTINVRVDPPVGSSFGANTISGVSVLGDTSVTVILPSTFSFSGVLTSDNSMPIPGIEIRLGSNTTTTGTDGSFNLYVTPGTYMLSLYGQRFPDSDAQNIINLTIPNISISADIIQNITVPLVTLRTTVTDLQGNPIPNAYVGLREHSINSFEPFPGAQASGYETIGGTRTDSAGVVELLVIPTSQVTINAYPPDGSTYAQNSVSGVSLLSDTNITITLPNTVSFSGVLTDSNGATLPDIQLSMSNATTRTGVDGSFRLNVFPGTYTLNLYGQRLPGLNSQSIINLAVPDINISSDTVQNLTIPTVTITVTVADSEGNPIVNAQPYVGQYNVKSFEIYSGKQASGTGFVSGGNYTNAQGVAQWPMLIPNDQIKITVNPPSGSNFGQQIINGVVVTQNTSVAVVYQLIGPITAPAEPVLISSSINTSARFIDPHQNETILATWDWGDGSSSQITVTENNGTGTVNGSHTYSTTGVYTVTLSVGSLGQSVFQYVVVYDSNGGFVTGSGTIDSPQGAFLSDPSLVGKAVFGISIKYQQGDTVPSGQTKFTFKDADLKFESTGYSWLVVSSTKAVFKGTGTVNRQGNYTFLVSVMEGINGGETTFRIKITDNSNNTVIYDDQAGTSEIADPVTMLTSGKISIH